MTLANDLYLVAHKCRGEPCFSIALRCDELGTETDPGPWWIDSVTGHRFYPWWDYPITEFWLAGELRVDRACPPMPSDAIDTFIINEWGPKETVIIPSLEALGLRKPILRRIP